MRLLVTLGTDGTTDWVRTPDGQKYNLGSVSALSFVTKLVLGGNREAKLALDRFLQGKEVILRVDDDKMWDLLTPRRTRWATDSFMPSDHRKQGTRIMTIKEDLGALEAHVQKLKQAAEARVSAAKMAEGVSILVRMASAIDIKASDDVPEEDDSSEEEDVKVASQTRLAYDIHKANSELATQILDKMELINDRIDYLVIAGKRFNATRAKADIHTVTSKIAGIVNDVDLTVPWVTEDLQKLAARADQLHRLFFVGRQ